MAPEPQETQMKFGMMGHEGNLADLLRRVPSSRQQAKDRERERGKKKFKEC